MTSARHVADQERRSRLGVRHGLASGCRVADPWAATTAMTVLHATEPATVYLSLAARTDGLSVAAVDRALFEERTLVRQLAMRRTLFVFPRELLPAAWGSASARVAAQLRGRLASEVERAGLTTDGTGWVVAAGAAVEDRLGGGDMMSAQALREELAELGGRLELAPGRAYGGSFPVAPRVLTWLGAEGRIVRGPNAGHWRTSRPLWVGMGSWLGTLPDRLEEAEGYARLARGWLRTFGPGTEDDLAWWLGATRAAVRRALADLRAVAVSLDGGLRGWLLPDDLDPVARPAPWAALLPALDPTTMGWRHRDFYLPPEHTPSLFDRNGNAGTTAWWDGRVVGCWVQDEAGAVTVVLCEDPGPVGRAALDVEAARLTRWLDGLRVNSVYASPRMRSALQD